MQFHTLVFLPAASRLPYNAQQEAMGANIAELLRRLPQPRRRAAVPAAAAAGKTPVQLPNRDCTPPVQAPAKADVCEPATADWELELARPGGQRPAEVRKNTPPRVSGWSSHSFV
jgi:hypothetical protein